MFVLALNNVTLLGRVGGDPEIKGDLEKPFVKFSLATSENYKTRDSDDWVRKTTWHNIVVFKPSLVDTVSNYLTKGTRVLVQGKLDYRTYEDEENPEKKHKYTSIIANDLVSLSGSKRD